MYNLNRHFKFIILWGMIIAILALVVSLILPKYYSADSDVLIMTRASGGVDPYTQAKSAERIGENLAQVLPTTDFYKKVMSQLDLEFDKNVWEDLTDRKQRKKWARDVRAGVKYGTNMMHITTYARTKIEAVNLSNAVVATVIKSGWEYVGNEVVVKPVNDPLVSFLPARPNMILNMILGFVLGILLSTLWVVKSKEIEYNN